jgi:TolB-like protein/Flp pilus assembly protein TadD
MPTPIGSHPRVGEFLQRLRERKLVQWALAYVAATFALIQVLDVIAQRFGWPDVLERVLILALAVGFFITLVLAWYHGERGAQSVTRTEFVILTLLLAIGGGLVWRYERVPQPRNAAAPSPAAALQQAIVASDKSVAVLPLTNAGGDTDQQYFSDGLSEDLITALSQFDGLKVISRNSAFQFRDSKLSSDAIGRALGVAHLLEGSVRRLQDQVRISAELVNAADGSTLWSQHYDRAYKDLFALQDEITNAVATALKARLLESSAATPQSERPPSGNLDAWNAYSRARFHAVIVDPVENRQAIDFYEQAIALDPLYANAYAGMSLSWTTLGGTFLSGEEQRQAFVKARAAVDRALQLDPTIARAHLARGLLLQWADFDWTGAESEYRRATELAPGDGLARAQLGRLLGALGHPQQAILLIRQSIGTDPRDASAWYWLGWYLAADGQWDEAEQAARNAVSLRRGKSFVPAGLAIIQASRGEHEAALASAQLEPPGTWRDIALAIASQGGNDRAAADAALQNLIAKTADGSAYQIAEVYGLRKDADNLFKWLDRAWDTRDSGISRLLTDPFILPYRSDPRFAAFCKKVGLPATTDAKLAP